MQRSLKLSLLFCFQLKKHFHNRHAGTHEEQSSTIRAVWLSKVLIQVSKQRVGILTLFEKCPTSEETPQSPKGQTFSNSKQIRSMLFQVSPRGGRGGARTQLSSQLLPFGKTWILVHRYNIKNARTDTFWHNAANKTEAGRKTLSVAKNIAPGIRPRPNRKRKKYLYQSLSLNHRTELFGTTGWWQAKQNVDCSDLQYNTLQ